MKKISIIIPIKNEVKSLNVLLNEIKEVTSTELINEIIIVDGNSTDGSLDVAKKYGCKIIIQKDVLGYGAAIVEGIKNSNSYYSVILDGDGSKNPIYIKTLFKSIENNNDDFIFASRYGTNCGSSDDTLLTHFGNRIFTIIGKIFFNIKINDILHTFFICKNEKFNEIKFKYHEFSFCAELPIVISKLEIPHSQIPTHERKRIADEVKVNSFIDGYKILLSMIKMFFKI